MGAQRRHALDRAVDHVARLQEQFRRVGFAHRHAARRAGGEHVRRLDRDVAREMLEEVGQLPDLVARVDAHPLLPVYGTRHPQVVGVADFVHGHDLGPQGPEARDVLGGPEARARGDLALLQVAAGEIVQDGDPDDVVESVLFLGAQRALADDEYQLRLVIEADDALGPRDPRVVAAERAVQLDETGRLLRRLGQKVVPLQFLEMRAVVLPGAKELAGVGDGRQVANLALIEQGRGEPRAVRVRLRRELAHLPHCRIARGEQVPHARGRGRFAGDARGRREIEHLAADPNPDPWRARSAQGKSDEAHARARGTLALFPRRQFLRGDLRLDALRFGGVEVQLDLDAVRVVHEQLVERLSVRAPLAELDPAAAQVRHRLLQPLRAKRDMVDGARARAGILGEAPEVGLLVVARVLRALADV